MYDSLRSILLLTTIKDEDDDDADDREQNKRCSKFAKTCTKYQEWSKIFPILRIKSRSYLKSLKKKNSFFTLNISFDTF